MCDCGASESKCGSCPKAIGRAHRIRQSMRPASRHPVFTNASKFVGRSASKLGGNKVLTRA